MDFLKSVGVLLVVYKRNWAIWPLSVFFLIFLCIYFFPCKKVQFGRKMRFFWATNHCAMNIVLRICAVEVTAGEASPKMQFVPISSRKFYHFLSFLLLFSGKT